MRVSVNISVCAEPEVPELDSVGGRHSLLPLHCLHQKADFINGSFQLICSSLDTNTSNESFGICHGFDNASHRPRIPRCRFVYNEYHVTDGEVPTGPIPFLTLLQQREVLFRPSLPEQVCDVLNLPPSSPDIEVLFPE